MTIPPFPVSFSSSLRTRTRSCRGVMFTVISLTSVQSISKNSNRQLLVALGQHYGRKLFWFFCRVTSRSLASFFLALGFSFGALLLVQFHSFRNGKFSFGIDSLRINNQPQNIAERRTDKIAGILCIFP